jgi:parvulin-like peptidyl-prolyl isomerase
MLCACAGGPGTRAVATVDGKPIAESDFAAVMPMGMDTTPAGDSARLRLLDNLINKKLFVAEALRRGMDKDIQYQLELEQRSIVNQELYKAVTGAGDKVNDTELQAAYKLMGTELHLKVIAVKDESLAQRVAAELGAGAPFETLATRYSSMRGSANGGDVGFVPAFFIEDPLRSRALALKPGEHTEPVKYQDQYQIIMLVESRPNAELPAYAEYKQELEMRVKTQRKRELAGKYLTDMRARIEYVDQSVDLIAFKPLDSITDAERDLPVAIKDKTKYVKVARLLAVAARFPAGLDTAMRRYAVKREIEDDLMYEDALKRGLDKKPDIRKQLARRHDDLLYQELFKKEVSQASSVTDADVAAYYQQNKANFTDTSYARVSAMIRSRLQRERGDARFKEFADGLRAKAKISVNQALLRKVKRPEPPAKPGQRPMPARPASPAKPPAPAAPGPR